jgi:hypothetical protein
VTWQKTELMVAADDLETFIRARGTVPLTE